MGEGEFFVRVVCPEKKAFILKITQTLSMFASNDSLRRACSSLNAIIKGRAGTPNWQVLYTTYVHTCSPLRDGDNLLPIPLYRNSPTFNGDHKAVIKWQTEWQACDELQMAGGCKAEHAVMKFVMLIVCSSKRLELTGA